MDQSEIPEVSAEILDQGDAPIAALHEDRLGRRGFAEALAAEVMVAPATRGYVMGLTGPWGSGKTSILNMTADAIGDDAIVVQFNPWMFSGTEALVSSFFEEIGKQLGERDRKLRGVADKLATYGRLLSPLASVVGAGAAVTAAADAVERLAARPSVFDQHQELRSLLDKLSKRLVVIVDDVDRLRPHEVLDIVRLVRLVGDFPNTLYLLAFDRGRVEECLGEGSIERGRAYLEKIVQVTHDVPAARQPDVAAIFIDGLGRLIEAVPTGPLDVGDWQNIFAFVVRPLLGTPRHVRRLLGSLSMTMRLVGDEVALADLIAMEAVRVLRPAMFEALISVADHLSARSLGLGQTGYQHGRSAADSPIGPMCNVDPGFAHDICRWLFPSALQYFENMHYGPEWEADWRLKRKVASSNVLRFYLERQLPEGVVPASAVEEALSQLGDRDGLQAFLDTFSPPELMDLIERMNPAIEDIPVATDHVGQDPARVALPVLLDLLSRLPENAGHPQYTGTMTVMRPALRLLRRIPGQDFRTGVVRGVLEDTRTLSGRIVLLWIAGHRENIGSGLIDASVATELEDQLRRELIALLPAAFAAESRTVRLARLMAETDEGKAALCALAEDDRVMLSLFAESVGDMRAQTLGAAAVEVTKVMGWDGLALYLGEDMLKRRTTELLAAVRDDQMAISPEERVALDLAADYASGNRPDTASDRIARLQTAGATSGADEHGGMDDNPDDGQPTDGKP